MTKSDDHALVGDLQDWLRELHELRRRALALHDTVQAAELQAEIEELTEALEFDRATPVRQSCDLTRPSATRQPGAQPTALHACATRAARR
jgi:hypothetical protein